MPIRNADRLLRTCAAALIAAPLAVVALGPSAPSAHAQPQAPRSYTLDSEHYEIVTDLRPSEIRDIARHMDATYESYERLFSAFNTRNDQRVRLYLWSDRETYIRHGRSLGADLSASGGVFFRAGGEAGVSTWVEGQSERWLRELLQHEGFHQFAHLRFGDTLPIWINEGLAVYYQHARMVRGRLLLGTAPRDKIEMLRKGFEEGIAFTFEEIVGLDSNKWWGVMNTQPHRTSLMYAQSWAVAHFLIHADDGRYRGMFETYLKRIAQGRDHASAYEDAFGTTDKKAFGERWRDYIMNEMTPDPLTEAAERVEFLAEGIKALAAEGVEPHAMPETMEALKAELQSRSFTVTREHLGDTHTLEATDEMFEAPEPASDGRRRSRSRAAEMKLVEGRRGMPPTIIVRGLKAEVRLEWIAPDSDDDDNEDSDATLRYEVVFR